MRFRENENDKYQINNCLFENFVDNSGGVISVNNSRVQFESIQSYYFRCKATEVDWYDRNSISGGAIAFFGFSSTLEKNCFEKCKGINIGSTVYVRSKKGRNSHTFNTYSQNQDGDGPLTSDGENSIVLIDNNLTNMISFKNTGIAISGSSAEDAKRNNFVKLKSESYYIWAQGFQKYQSCNFIDFFDKKSAIIYIGESLSLVDCILKLTPHILFDENKNIVLQNLKSDRDMYSGTKKLSNIDVMNNLNLIKIGGNYMCNAVTDNKCYQFKWKACLLFTNYVI